MTQSTLPPEAKEWANLERRKGKRLLRLQPCFYQLVHIAGHEVVEFSDGHALSLNHSSGGSLLLMPQLPERRQVFEVHTVLSGDETTVKIVETCWTREMTFGDNEKVYLVGVRLLLEPVITS